MTHWFGGRSQAGSGRKMVSSCLSCQQVPEGDELEGRKCTPLQTNMEGHHVPPKKRSSFLQARQLLRSIFAKLALFNRAEVWIPLVYIPLVAQPLYKGIYVC